MSTITVHIGDAERTLSEADEQWVSQQVSKRRREGLPVCARVSIRDGAEVNLALSTPSCPSGGVGGRAPNARESRILDLWEKRGLRQDDFGPGALIAFLKQVESLL